MFSKQTQKKSGQTQKPRASQAGARQLYSIAAWPEKLAFVGNLSVGGPNYRFAYAPSHAEAINNLLRLTGRLTVTDARGRVRTLSSVRATLANQQGGIGSGPIRRQLIATAAPTGAQTTSQQRQQAAAETEKQAGEIQRDPAKSTISLPVTENTGSTSYCGVLYFHFEPLDSSALGIPVKMTKVQLNVRLESLDEAARTLQGLYCYVVDALYGERRDGRLAEAAISELNRVLAG